MDRKKLWAELIATAIVAWLTMPDESRRRVAAGTLIVTARACRGAAAELGRAALAAERRYYEVIRP